MLSRPFAFPPHRNKMTLERICDIEQVPLDRVKPVYEHYVKRIKDTVCCKQMRQQMGVGGGGRAAVSATPKSSFEK